MLLLDVDFYDEAHRELLKANCERYGELTKLVDFGLELTEEELFSYSMFTEQLPTSHGWESYRELQTELPAFRQTWERYFDCSVLTLHARHETALIRPPHKEAVGVGCALSIASRVYGLTEADWQKIPEYPGLKTLDFKIASTGTGFIEVEAKGSVVPDHKKSHLSDHKRDIEEKKIAQRKKGNTSTLIGVIAAIPSDSTLRTKCFLLDPPPTEIPLDPLKYRLLARLYFYWRELSLVSRSHFLEILINRIKAIQSAEDYNSLDGLALLNSRGEPHKIPNSLFETRSCVYGRSAFGEAIRLPDGQFFFYGFDTDVVEALINQRVDELKKLSFKSRIEPASRVSAKVPRRLISGLEAEVEFDEDKEDEARKTIRMTGDLTHTPCGRVLGVIQPTDDKRLTEA